jgi:hypothetical protein
MKKAKPMVLVHKQPNFFVAKNTHKNPKIQSQQLVSNPTKQQ